MCFIIHFSDLDDQSQGTTSQPITKPRKSKAGRRKKKQKRRKLKRKRKQNNLKKWGWRKAFR